MKSAIFIFMLPVLVLCVPIQQSDTAAGAYDSAAAAYDSAKGVYTTDATITFPDGRPAVTPDGRTVATPGGRTVVTPDGHTVVIPDGTNAQNGTLTNRFGLFPPGGPLGLIANLFGSVFRPPGFGGPFGPGLLGR